MELKDYIESKYPFEDFLKDIHAKGYSGLDDDMPDAFETWVTNLDCEELIEHGNVFSKIILDSIYA